MEETFGPDPHVGAVLTQEPDKPFDVRGVVFGRERRRLRVVPNGLADEVANVRLLLRTSLLGELEVLSEQEAERLQFKERTADDAPDGRREKPGRDVELRRVVADLGSKPVCDVDRVVVRVAEPERIGHRTTHRSAS